MSATAQNVNSKTSTTSDKTPERDTKHIVDIKHANENAELYKNKISPAASTGRAASSPPMATPNLKPVARTAKSTAATAAGSTSENTTQSLYDTNLNMDPDFNLIGCSICLEFNNKQYYTNENCEHALCADCINLYKQVPAKCFVADCNNPMIKYATLKLNPALTRVINRAGEVRDHIIKLHEDAKALEAQIQIQTQLVVEYELKLQGRKKLTQLKVKATEASYVLDIKIKKDQIAELKQTLEKIELLVLKNNTKEHEAMFAEAARLKNDLAEKQRKMNTFEKAYRLELEKIKKEEIADTTTLIQKIEQTNIEIQALREKLAKQDLENTRQIKQLIKKHGVEVEAINQKHLEELSNLKKVSKAQKKAETTELTALQKKAKDLAKDLASDKTTVEELTKGLNKLKMEKQNLHTEVRELKSKREAQEQEKLKLQNALKQQEADHKLKIEALNLKKKQLQDQLALEKQKLQTSKTPNPVVLLSSAANAAVAATTVSPAVTNTINIDALKEQDNVSKSIVITSS